jgi:putative flippase GtrA
MTVPLGEILRFGIVGITATAVHLGVLAAGVELLNVPPVVMNGAAFCVAVSITYFGQSLWVFRAGRRDAGQISRFATSVLIGVLGNMAIMAFSVHILDVPYLYGFIASLILVPAVSFLLSKFWVFAN